MFLAFSNYVGTYGRAREGGAAAGGLVPERFRCRKSLMHDDDAGSGSGRTCTLAWTGKSAADPACWPAVVV